MQVQSRMSSAVDTEALLVEMRKRLTPEEVEQAKGWPLWKQSYLMSLRYMLPPFQTALWEKTVAEGIDKEPIAFADGKKFAWKYASGLVKYKDIVNALKFAKLEANAEVMDPHVVVAASYAVIPASKQVWKAYKTEVNRLLKRGPEAADLREWADKRQIYMEPMSYTEEEESKPYGQKKFVIGLCIVGKLYSIRVKKAHAEASKGETRAAGGSTQ